MSRSVSAPSSVTNTSPCWKGFIVPGSTLRYGSSFCIVTRNPRALSRRPRLEAVSPLPRLEATPPVTKTCLVTCGWATPGTSSVGLALPGLAGISTGIHGNTPPEAPEGTLWSEHARELGAPAGRPPSGRLGLRGRGEQLLRVAAGERA